jgi:hypothetical protein
MADTYTSSLRIAQQTVGGNENTWGTILNSSLAMLDAAIAGVAFVSVTAGNVTLSASNNADDQARLPLIIPTGSPGTTRTITAPNVEKLTWVYNSTADGSAITWSAGGGATVTIPSGNVAMIFSDGATNAAALLNMNATVSGQIRFPAAQNASADANTLDDYEEGTFTPTLGDGTNNFTLSFANGFYTKIGDTVHAHAYAIWTSIGAAGSPALRIGALPFASSSSMQYGFAFGGMSGIDVTASTKQICGETQGGTEVRFNVTEDNATASPLAANTCSATGAISGSICYKV